MDAPRITPGKAGAVLAVRVQPRASREGVVGLHGESLKVALTAPPVDGAANAALLALLGRLFGVAPSSLSLVRGATGREKAIQFEGLDVAALTARARGVLSGLGSRGAVP